MSSLCVVKWPWCIPRPDKIYWYFLVYIFKCISNVNFSNFDPKSTKNSSKEFSWQKGSIGLSCNMAWPGHNELILWGLMTNSCFSKLSNCCFRWWWLVTWSAPRHYLDQCWLLCHSDPYQQNLNQNTIFIQENWFKNVIYKISAILSQP